MHRFVLAWVCAALMLCAFAASRATAQQAGSISTTPPVVDLIIVVDNSASMGAGIESLQNELYDHLAGPLLTAGVGLRVIVVAKFGALASESVCFEEPLSSIPTGGCATPPALPGNTELFRQYSIEVNSHDAWCLLMDTYNGSVADDFGLAPIGWQDWLQPDAFKVILMVTDDGVICDTYNDMNSVADGANAAESIDTDLLALSPTHFGTDSNRNYIVHSLIGIEENTPSTVPWPPSAPVSTLECVSAIDPGTGHQWLSVDTGGFRFPVCETNNYAVYFGLIAESIFPAVALFRDRFQTE